MSAKLDTSLRLSHLDRLKEKEFADYSKAKLCDSKTSRHTSMTNSATIYQPSTGSLTHRYVMPAQRRCSIAPIAGDYTTPLKTESAAAYKKVLPTRTMSSITRSAVYKLNSTPLKINDTKQQQQHIPHTVATSTTMQQRRTTVCPSNVEKPFIGNSYRPISTTTGVSKPITTSTTVTQPSYGTTTQPICSVGSLTRFVKQEIKPIRTEVPQDTKTTTYTSLIAPLQMSNYTYQTKPQFHIPSSKSTPPDEISVPVIKSSVQDIKYPPPPSSTLLQDVYNNISPDERLSITHRSSFHYGKAIPPYSATVSSYGGGAHNYSTRTATVPEHKYAVQSLGEQSYYTQTAKPMLPLKNFKLAQHIGDSQQGDNFHLIQSARTYEEKAVSDYHLKYATATAVNKQAPKTILKKDTAQQTITMDLSKEELTKLKSLLTTFNSKLVTLKPLTEKLQEHFSVSKEKFEVTQEDIDAFKSFISLFNVKSASSSVETLSDLIEHILTQLSLTVQQVVSDTVKTSITIEPPKSTYTEKKNVIQKTFSMEKEDAQHSFSDSTRPDSTDSTTQHQETKKITKQTEVDASKQHVLPFMSLKDIQKLNSMTLDSAPSEKLYDTKHQFHLQQEYLYSLQIETSYDGKTITRCVDVIKIYKSPSILLMTEFLTTEECDELKQMQKEDEFDLVFSTSAYSDEECMVEILRRRLAAILKIDRRDITNFSIIQRKPDDQPYKQSLPCKSANVVIFLCDVPKGGTLEFESLGLHVTPHCGTAIVWINTSEDTKPLNNVILPPSQPAQFVICELKNCVSLEQCSTTQSIKDDTTAARLDNFKINARKSPKLPKTVRKKRIVEDGKQPKLQTVKENEILTKK